MAQTFLIVDDSPTVRLSTKKMLAREDADEERIREAETGEEALEMFEEERPDVVLLDINLPGIQGHEVAERMFEIAPDSRIVIITGATEDDERVRDTIRKGAFEIITKPIRQDDIQSLMRLIADESEGVDRIQ
jgi:CheY-like chemotaxis protein